LDKSALIIIPLVLLVLGGIWYYTSANKPLSVDVADQYQDLSLDFKGSSYSSDQAASSQSGTGSQAAVESRDMPVSNITNIPHQQGRYRNRI
jgi:hypothetical protein